MPIYSATSRSLYIVSGRYIGAGEMGWGVAGNIITAEL